MRVVVSLFFLIEYPPTLFHHMVINYLQSIKIKHKYLSLADVVLNLLLISATTTQAISMMQRTAWQNRREKNFAKEWGETESLKLASYE